MELLVVVLIIGLLTGIVAPRLLGQINRSEITTAKAQMDAFDKALQGFRIDMGRYPTDAEGLRALVEAPASDPRWRGPYLKGGIPADPWGTPYGYRGKSTSGKDFDLLSLGRDRAEGGTGDDADIRY
jgi:general secretion pathway protein G